jgi:hypothetical protein
MLRRLDHWVGKHLFVPPIVRVCQLAKITQYRFIMYARLVAYIALISDPPQHWYDWILYIWLTLVTLIYVFGAGLLSDEQMAAVVKKGDHFNTRMLFWFLTFYLLAVQTGIHKTYSPWELAPLFLLFAEYARTIDTIPPLEAKEKKTSANPKLAPARRRA